MVRLLDILTVIHKNIIMKYNIIIQLINIKTLKISPKTIIKSISIMKKIQILILLI